MELKEKSFYHFHVCLILAIELFSFIITLFIIIILIICVIVIVCIDVLLGVLGENGVTRVITQTLTKEEEAKLQKSANDMIELQSKLASLSSNPSNL